jgi:hypothetical protein
MSSGVQSAEANCGSDANVMRRTKTPTIEQHPTVSKRPNKLPLVEHRQQVGVVRSLAAPAWHTGAGVDREAGLGVIPLKRFGAWMLECDRFGHRWDLAAVGSGEHELAIALFEGEAAFVHQAMVVAA